MESIIFCNFLYISLYKYINFCTLQPIYALFYIHLILYILQFVYTLPFIYSNWYIYYPI